MGQNLYKLYYKDYFSKIDFTPILRNGGQEISGSGLVNPNNALTGKISLENDVPSAYVTHKIRMKVLYPGLITGIGIAHEAKVTGEFKLGMNFDFTTGMPIIYGSSVKGVLRAYFKEVYTEDNADEMIEDIFEGCDSEGNPKSIYARDIFFDAVVVKTDEKGKLFASDSITPHNKGRFSDPIPITFMKISPGCKIEFRFHLVDSPKGLSADKKLNLFKEILETFGVGAKTNVGYGQLQSI